MLSPVTVDAGTVPYALIVLIMLAVEVFLLLALVPKDGSRAPVAFGILVATALLGSAGALLGVFWAVLYPNLNSFTIVFEALGISMGFPPGLWMISIIVYHDDRIAPGDRRWPVLLALLATGGELLMGLVFTAADGAFGPASSAIAATLVSPWYLWSSATAMIALLLWVPLDTGRRRVLLGLAASGVAAPWVAADPAVGAVLMTAAMGATFVAIYRSLRTPSTAAGVGAILPAVLAAYVAMSVAGVAVAVAGASDVSLLGFGSVMTVVMFGELTYLLTEGLGAPAGAPAPSRTVADALAAPVPP